MKADFLNEQGNLLCAHCHNDSMHPEATFLTTGDDDLGATQLCVAACHVPGEGESYFLVRPSYEKEGYLPVRHRELSTCAVFACENCARFTRVGFGFHKGTIVFVYEAMIALEAEWTRKDWNTGKNIYFS